jgi:ABC-type glycerol-3-phosphate transport system substrate-binding protein
MKGIRKTLAVLASVGLLAAIAGPAFAQQLKSTEDVRTALRLLVQVSNDFKRQITNKNFARVPHEYMEYTEAADALRSAIKDEPADFKAKVETRLKAAVAAYQKVSDMSANAKETDVDKLMAEHAKAVTAMNAVFDLFPAALRPDPNLPPPGRGGRGRSN